MVFRTNFQIRHFVPQTETQPPFKHRLVLFPQHVPCLAIGWLFAGAAAAPVVDGRSDED
jgi:hypothetical protein